MCVVGVEFGAAPRRMALSFACVSAFVVVVVVSRASIAPSLRNDIPERAKEERGRPIEVRRMRGKGKGGRIEREGRCRVLRAWRGTHRRQGRHRGLVVASAVDGGEAIEAERLSVQRQQRRQRRQSGRVARAQRITSTTIDYAQQHRAGSLSRESRTYCALTLAVSARYITALR